MQEKKEKLAAIIRSCQSLMIAFSGGIDSMLLLKIARDILGEKVCAITATSELYFSHEQAEAIKIASGLGVSHLLIQNKALSNNEFVQNHPDRCYICKKELFLRIREAADSKQIRQVADGTNLDDTKTYRPGLKALDELGIISPLKEAGFTKYEVRELARAENIESWNKPSLACLASRFPYYTPVTSANLIRVRKVEDILRGHQFRQFRARFHGDIIRIELNAPDMMKMMDTQLKNEVVNDIKSLGFHYVTLDLEGFRSGSMDEVLS